MYILAYVLLLHFFFLLAREHIYDEENRLSFMHFYGTVYTVYLELGYTTVINYYVSFLFSFRLQTDTRCLFGKARN